MSTNMRVTRSRGGGTGAQRPTLRNRPPTPRGQGTSAVFRTPSPRRTRRSSSRNSTGSVSSRHSTRTSSSTNQPIRTSQQDSEENINQTEQPLGPENIGQPGEVEQLTSQLEGAQPGEENQQPQPGNQSRPPTPNWTGFTPQPNFQEAREHDRQVFEAGEEEEDHPSYSKIWNRPQVVAMEPMSIDNSSYLDYRSSQSIKFFNKGVEKLPGEAFTGKNIFSWLRRLEIKANEFHWIPTLTIDGKLLTTHFAELSMEKVKQAAMEFQIEAQRKAQNSRMIFYCIISSVSSSVMDKLTLKRHLFTLEVRGKLVQDGVCMLKVLIDSYYASTRFTTIEIRKQLASLPTYMQVIAKGDVTKLCEHTRKLNAELEASGERTLDLVANLLAALEKTHNPVFQRWLEGRRNMWALKQIEWKEDGSDLMDEAEAFYLNLREGKSWKKTHDERDRAYALKASDASVTTDSSSHVEVLKELTEELKAFAATEKEIRESKYKWKQIPPRDGEQTTKRVLIDGVKKKYYWCVHHKMWTLHSPAECRKADENRKKRKSPSKHQGPSKRKKIQEKARMAFEALALLANNTNPSNSSSDREDSNQDSNFSDSSSSSNSNSTIESYKTAEYETDES
jgi:hypothetical protein